MAAAEVNVSVVAQKRNKVKNYHSRPVCCASDGLSVSWSEESPLAALTIQSWDKPCFRRDTEFALPHFQMRIQSTCRIFRRAIESSRLELADRDLGMFV